MLRYDYREIIQKQVLPHKLSKLSCCNTPLSIYWRKQPTFDEVQQCPFVVADNMFVGYDDRRSWKSKIKWMQKAGYGGVIVWALDLDDFNGTFCNQGTKKNLACPSSNVSVSSQ